MPRRVISIEIGLHKTKIVEVSFKKKNPHIYHCITFATPEHVYEDGYIGDKNRLASVIKEKLQEARIKTNQVVFAISSTKIATREVTIPPVKDRQIPEIIAANATEYFPVDLSEYTISHRVLEKITDKEDKKLRLYLLAAPNNLIKSYYELADLLGLTVVAIDYVGNSTYQMLKEQMPLGTSLVIQINEQATLISIIEKNTLKLQRTITYGTVDLAQAAINYDYPGAKTEAEALQLLYEKELFYTRFDASYEEVAVAMELVPEDEVGGNINYAKREITDSLRYFISNILRMLNYYSSISKKRVDTIYLIGDGAKIAGMKELLYSETGLKVQGMNQLAPVTLYHKSLDLQPGQLMDYLVGIGASIDPINFIPGSDLHGINKYSLIYNTSFILIGSVIIGIIFIGAGFIKYRVAYKQNAILKNEIESRADINELYDEYQEVLALFHHLQKLHSTTSNPNENLIELLVELETKLPKKTTVKTMNITSKDITLSLETDSKETAAFALQQLKTIPYITAVYTNGINDGTIRGNDVGSVTFVITAEYDMEFLQEESNEDN